MRHLLLLTGFLAGLGPEAAAQSRTWKQVSVRVRSCARADSVLGVVTGKARKVPALAPPDSGALILTVGSDQVNQGLSTHSLQITLHAARTPHPGFPDATVSFLITGDAGRRLLATKEVPALSIELADSIILHLAPVSLGSYDGPPSFAVAPLSSALGPNSLLAMVRSDSLLARAGLSYLRPTPTFREKLRDAFRVATCGYDEGS